MVACTINNFKHHYKVITFKHRSSQSNQMKLLLSFIFFSSICLNGFAQPAKKRALKPSDLFHFKYVEDAQVSPSGKWVAYTLSNADTIKDKMSSDIWMVSWDGKENIQLTNNEESESKPGWSPDGKYISFVSERYGEKVAQIWLMDTRGGEAKKITSLKGELQDYTWSPDGNKIAMSIKDEDFSDTAKSKTRAPYVTNRYLFKKDIEGLASSGV